MTDRGEPAESAVIMMAKPDQRPTIVPHDTKLSPPPPGVRHVSIPILGIIIADDDVRHRVARRFHWPMIVLALAILPLLLIEFFRNPEPGTALRYAVEIGFAVIWLAFVVEFIIKVAIAESRPEYVRRNWLDVIIIVVPILRPLRVARLTRTARVFKLRGVGMKFARYVITIVVGMEATERLLQRIGVKGLSGRRDPARMTRHQLITEVKQLRRSVDRWESWHKAHEGDVADQGGPCSIEPPDAAGEETPDEAEPRVGGRAPGEVT